MRMREGVGVKGGKRRHRMQSRKGWLELNESDACRGGGCRRVGCGQRQV